MTLDEIKVAVETGHNAASVLMDVLQELVDNHHCPESFGFEGPDTFSGCDECVYCLAKTLIERHWQQHAKKTKEHSPEYDSGLGTTPMMWQMLSEALAANKEKLPESLNNAIYTICEGRAVVVLKNNVT